MAACVCRDGGTVCGSYTRVVGGFCEMCRRNGHAANPAAAVPASPPVLEVPPVMRGTVGGEFEDCVVVRSGRHLIEACPPKNGIAMLVVDGFLYPLKADEAAALAEVWATQKGGE